MSVPVLGTFNGEALESGLTPPEPGERCALCNRRRNRKANPDAPKEVREVRFRGPADLIQAIEEQFDMLQEYTGLDPYGFPRARLLEALSILGIQQREELAARFRKED